MDTDRLLRLENTGWRLEGGEKGKLVKHYGLENFGQVSKAVVAIMEMAAAEDHHPEVSFGYKDLRIAWRSHEKGGVFERDLAMAERSDSLVSKTE